MSQDEFQPAVLMTISELETLRVLTDPLRIRVLETMMEGPTTVKQIAETLDIPATKLYYHVNLLEKHGLIVVVDTQVVSGIIEKHYQAVAESFQIDRSLLAFETNVNAGEFGVIELMLDPVREEIRSGLRSGLIQASPDAPAYARLSMSRTRVMLTHEQAEEFNQRIHSLLDDLKAINQDEDITGKHAYALLVAFYPTQIGRRSPDAKEQDHE
jgi:DNA-binding transcriptional ArsR family regulator